MPKLAIPPEALDQHSIALGKTGAGKSSVIRYLVEYLFSAKKRICIIDPKGDWWGIKADSSGRKAGLPFVLFGDFKNAAARDVPVNDRSGKHIAELVAGGNRPCVIGMRGWTQGGMTRFWIDFASTLFSKNTGELYLVGDEFHNFAPKQWKGQADRDNPVGVGLHWANRLLSEGRGLGLVCLLASQRPQKVHNDTLTSCETLLAMRVVHAADRAAIKAWIDGNGDPAVGAEVINSLAQLERGEAWVWSPEIGFGPKRVKFPMFSTFDSFAPPQLQKRVNKKGWAGVDLSEVQSKLEQEIKEAEANDPKLLRARIADLERKSTAKASPAAIDPRAIEIAFNNGFVEGSRKIAEGVANMVGRSMKTLEDLKQWAIVCKEPAGKKRPQAPPARIEPVKLEAKKIVVQARVATAAPNQPAEGLTKTQQRILDVVATLNLRGITPNRDCVARWQAIHPKGGRYGGDLADLRAAGYLEGFELTELGQSAAKPWATGAEAVIDALQEGTQKKLFSTILENNGEPYVRDTLADALGIHPKGGRFGGDLAWLRTMGVITDRGPIKVTPGALA
jgi:uncharacterized protein